MAGKVSDKVHRNLEMMGRCQVCGAPIMVAAWVAKILKKMEREPRCCSREHADLLLDGVFDPVGALEAAGISNYQVDYKLRVVRMSGDELGKWTEYVQGYGEAIRGHVMQLVDWRFESAAAEVG